MDVTYTLKYLGYQTFLVDYYTSLSNPYLLLGITDPQGLATKYAIVDPTGADENWKVSIFGVNESEEDLQSGYVYFSELGTWDVSIYYQASSINQNPANATLLGRALFQIVDSYNPLDNPLDLQL